MINEKFIQLLVILKNETAQRRLKWEYLPDEGMVRARITPGAVRIGKADVSSEPTFQLWLINDRGDLVAEWEVRPDDEKAFNLIREVFTTANLVARGGERLLDEIIQSHPISITEAYGEAMSHPILPPRS